MQHKLGFGKILAEHDKAMMKFFSDMRVYHGEEGTNVPIVWSGDERFESMRSIGKDNSIVVQKIPLPQIWLNRRDLYRFSSRWRLEYQLTFRTHAQDEMNQLLEQLIMRFSPYAEVMTDKLGQMELEINRMKLEHQDELPIKIHRYDWLITTEVKQR